MKLLSSWKQYIVLLAMPLFAFLCLDFLYRFSTLTSARNALLSFSLLELFSFSVAAILGLGLALARLILKRDFLGTMAAYFSVLLTVFIFMVYSPFAVAAGRRLVFLISFGLATSLFIYFWRKNRLSPTPTILTVASDRFLKVMIGTTMISTIILAASVFKSGLWSPSQHVAQGIKVGDKKNVLVLVVDALGANHLSSYGYRDNQTPTFDRLAKESYFFMNARTNFTGTSVSIMHMLKGQSPLKTHFISYNHMPFELAQENLLSFFEKLGYRTESFAGAEYALLDFFSFPQPSEGEAYHPNKNWNNWLNRGLASLCRRFGFSLWFRFPPVPSSFVASERELQKNFFDQLLVRLETLSRKPEPFFFYAHTIIPYISQETLGDDMEQIGKLRGYYDLKNQFLIERARAAYDREVSQIDIQLGLFLEELKQKGFLENTIVVITADHGETFSRGFWGHGDDLSEDSIRVPLIIRAPNQHPEVINHPVQTSDIAPTILKLLGITQPKWMDGISAFDSAHQREVAVTFNFLGRVQIRRHVPFPGLSTGRSIAIYKNGLKYIEHPEGKKDELYEVASDPEESHNLIDLKPSEARGLHEELWTLLKTDTTAVSSNEGTLSGATP